MRGIGQAIDRLQKSRTCLFQLRSHCKFLGMRAPQIRTNLACAFGISTLLFGCVVWGHALGHDLPLVIPPSRRIAQVDKMH